MISFLSNWIEQIAISVIIVSIFELLLPNGNLKKYIKIVLGMYVVFCIISPFVNSEDLYKIKDVDLEEYVQNVQKSEATINQESMDLRLQELYIEQLKNDIENKVKENGYKVNKINIEANLDSSSSNPGIHSIELVLNEDKGIGNVEKVEIGASKEENQNNEDIEKLKENLSSHYEIGKDIINIRIK
jgi:stage III sporulation protein AF